jgi:hypothetical protein
MKETKKKVHIGRRSITDYVPEYEEQGYNYCLSGAVHESLDWFFGNLLEPEKVTDTVGTFLTEEEIVSG